MNKTNIKNAVKFALVALALVGVAHAEDTVAAQVTALTAGLTTVGTLAGGAAALGGSWAIYRKVKSYFSRA